MRKILLCLVALLMMSVEIKAQTADCDGDYYALESDDVVSIPELRVQFVWNAKYAELYVIQSGKHLVTEVSLNGTEVFHERLTEHVLAVYGIAQMEWEEDTPLFLAKVGKTCYYADVQQFDDHVELKVWAGKQVIFEKSWFA